MTPAITIYAVLVFLHVLAVVIWVGGMFVMHTAVRPSAAELLEPPQRLPLLTAILKRFFSWVAAAGAGDARHGIAMIALAGGMRPLHGSVYWMFGIGVVMMLIYGLSASHRSRGCSARGGEGLADGCAATSTWRSA